MGNRILAVVLGSFAAMFIVGGLEQLVPLLYPVPAHIEPMSKEAVEDMIKGMPAGAFCCLLTAYAFGTFTGAFLGGLISRKNRMQVSLFVGTIILAGGIVNFTMLKHPLWFVVVSLIIYLPSAYLGGMLAEQIGKKRTVPVPDEGNRGNQLDSPI